MCLASQLINNRFINYVMSSKQALDTFKGIIISELNYAVLEKTLKENFGLPTRIIRAHIMDLLNMQKSTPFSNPMTS